MSLEDVGGLTALDRKAVQGAVEALVAINVLAADRELDFVHPIVRRAIYGQIPPPQRQRLHARGDRIPPARCGGATVRDQLGSVLHELGLEEAADRQREEFDAHLRRALSLSSQPNERTGIALDFGRALASCGEFRGSVELFHETLKGDTALDDAQAVALEAEMLAMAFHEFTCTALAALYRQRRFAQLERGEDLEAGICVLGACRQPRSPPPAARLTPSCVAAPPG